MLNKKHSKIFFSGIGGSGVSAIACFMADKGHDVSGSDRAFDRNPRHPLLTILRHKGISIVQQDGTGIDDSIDLAVFSTAVELDSPEYTKAKELKIPVRTRPEYLAEIVGSYNTIAVSGTSGKSTVSGMLAYVMQRLGLSPNFIGGGRVRQFRTKSALGNSLADNSDLLVFEACESDGSIINYRPLHTIVLNLELDHHAIDNTAGMFKVIMQNTNGKIIVNADDVNLNKICSGNEIQFSIDRKSKYKAENVVYKSLETEFSINGNRFFISLPGKYNLYNALSCIALLGELGVPLKDIVGPLKSFQGIERRFEIKLDNGKKLVVDDYAHNPHKIASLMQAMRAVRNKVCYIFQPHGYAPTRMMKDEYIRAFSENLREDDHLILLPIFYAGGTVTKDISSHDLADGIKANGKSTEVSERNGIFDKLHKWESYVVMGARDESLSEFADEIAGRLKGAYSDQT